MNKDKTLEELFLRTKPHFDDKADFMESLIRRLDAVEFVRQHQEATIRRYKKAMIAAFVIGIIFFAHYHISKKMLAKEIEAEEKRITTHPE